MGWEFVSRPLNSGVEKVIAPAGLHSPWPFVSGPQRDLVFSRQADQDWVDVHRFSSQTGDDAVICRNCDELWDVSSSGRYLLAMSGKERRTVALMDTRTGRQRELLGHPQWNLYRATFSPDERSVLFTAKTAADRSVLFVAEFSGTECGPPERWVAVSDDTEYNGPAHWSPDGDRIYFTSQRDGYRCLYARKWDGRRRTAGPIAAIRHFHAEGESPGLIPQSLFGFAVARDKIVMEIGRRIGNIWLMK